MMKRLSMILAIVSLTGSGTIAGSVLCAEHRAWTAVARADLGSVNAGDIVRIERGEGRAHLTVVRAAADEIASPAN